jgi:hypothetical protein
MADREIEAMFKISEMFAELPADAIHRVLRWASEKYQIDLSQRQIVSEAHANTHTTSPFEDFASLFHAADPQSQNDAALVAGYWLQQCRGESDWDSQSANAELKNLGYPMSNISETLTRIINSRPRLVMQTLKSGSSRQARKRYKLTMEGITKIGQMISKKT